jgi:hypothetical protein
MFHTSMIEIWAIQEKLFLLFAETLQGPCESPRARSRSMWCRLEQSLAGFAAMCGAKAAG